MLRLENRLSQRFLRKMVSMSWCKYIQRDLFLLNNPRFSFWIADAFAYSMWKAVCPLLSGELDRIIEVSEKFNQILLLLKGISWLLVLFKKKTTVFLRSYTIRWPSWTAWVPGSKCHMEFSLLSIWRMVLLGLGALWEVKEILKVLLQDCPIGKSEVVTITLSITYSILVLQET